MSLFDFLRASFFARRLVAAMILVGMAALLTGSGTARADRWGTPYAAHVSAPSSVVYSSPDPSSPTVGPLWKDAIVVVTDTAKGADGQEWAQIPDGYVPLGDLSEMLTMPWTAEVSVPSVSVHAYPFATSAIMRGAGQGDLLRVMGVSKGLEGDTGLWWATTAGYVPIGTLKWATNDWASWWKLPAAADAPKGWWTVLIQEAHVRAAPTTESPVLGVFNGGEYVKVLSEEQGQPLDGDSRWYRIDGGRYAGGFIHNSVVRRLPDPKPNVTPPEGGSPNGNWIVVDRAHFSLTFVKNGVASFSTYVSLGKAGVDTPTGTYTTFGKFIGDRMSSRNVQNPTHPYDLPNVPYTEYYKDGGYAIHGTYWHDVFGTRESQGCINLTWSDAAYLFSLTLPQMPLGYTVAWGAAEDQTPVVILD